MGRAFRVVPPLWDRTLASVVMALDHTLRRFGRAPTYALTGQAAFDLTGSLRAAADLAGCDHKTVGHWVEQRERAGGRSPVARTARPGVGPFAEKVQELETTNEGR